MFYHEKKKFMKRKQKRIYKTVVSVWCTVEGGGEWVEGGPARIPMRTLRANAECAYIGFHLYCFPFCHLLILWWSYNIFFSKSAKRDEKCIQCSKKWICPDLLIPDKMLQEFLCEMFVLTSHEFMPHFLRATVPAFSLCHFMDHASLAWWRETVTKAQLCIYIKN